MSVSLLVVKMVCSLFKFCSSVQCSECRPTIGYNVFAALRGSGLSHTTLLRVPLFKYKQNINSWHFARSLEKLLVVRQLQPVYDSKHVTYKNAGFEYFVNPRFAKYSKPIPEIAEEQHTKTNT